MIELADDAVRPATTGDLDALIECDALARASDARRDALARWLEKGAVLVIQDGGDVAGFLVLEDSLFGHGFVPLVCVRPEERRQGRALRLFAAAEARCRTGKLFTSANATNDAAHALFARAGFVRSGTIENLDPGDPEYVYYKPVARDGDD